MSRDWRLALVILAAGAVVRLAIAALTPVFPDETYYWEWSRHLAPGYYDHPPMVALLIRAGTLVAGATPLGIRLCAVLAGTLAGLLLAAAARRLAGDRAAVHTALLFSVMPLSAAGLLLATPDAPLFTAAAAVTYAVVRVFAAEPGSSSSTRWWCAAGAALGVALCSKITAALLPLAIVVAIVATPAARRRLREPGPYLATLIAAVVFLPVVLWNARHGWISIGFQLQHGLGGTSGSVLKRELDLIGGQAGLVSPILFVMLAVAVAFALRDRDMPVRRALAVTALFLFGFFVYSATRRRVEANWPALAYLPAVLVFASVSGGRSWTRWSRVGIGLAAALTLVTYVNAFTPVLPIPARRDPGARAAGWRDLAAAVQRSRVEDPSAHVAADRYQEASALAFYLPDHPRTYSLNVSSRANQYDLWPRYPDLARRGDGMILVLDDLAGTPATVTLLAPHFDGVAQGPLVPLTRAGDLIKNLRVWRLSGWHGTWPPAPLRSRT